MTQLTLFDFKRDCLFQTENKIANYYDILKETENEIQYSEHICPKKGFAICGMEYEEYVDIKKENLNGLNYDKILTFLRKFKKEVRMDKYKELLKSRNIKFDEDLFTWNNSEL